MPKKKLPALEGAEAFKFTLEHDLNWTIFAEILFHAAEVVWVKVEKGFALHDAVIPSVLDGTADPVEKEVAFVAGSAKRLAIPFMLLAGFGVECYLKAIRIKQMRKAGEPCVQQTGKRVQLTGQLKTHDLVKLANAAGVPLDQAETGLLQRLGVFVQWAGRYPVSKDPEKPAWAGHYYITDHEAVQALAAKLRAFHQGLE